MTDRRRRLLVLDLEATCIDSPRCRVLAAAAIPIEDGHIDLSGAICGHEPSGSGAALVHGIVEGGEAPSGCTESLDRVLEAALSAETLIVYGAHDVMLLLAEARRRGLPLPPRICYIDLLAELLRNPVRLEEARRRGGLPLEAALSELLGHEAPEKAFHHPLDDAFHTALLYLAMLHRGGRPRTRCTGAGRRSLLARITRLLDR